MDNGILTDNFDSYNDVSNNRNEYVNNILNEYYIYNPNSLDKQSVLKKISKELNEITQEEKKEGIENPTESISNPVKIVSDQYESGFAQGVSMYDNRGKYFDLYNFNKNFDDYIRQQQKLRLLNEKLKLTDLSTIDSIKIKPYQLPIDKLLINAKDVWFEMYDKAVRGENPITKLSNDDFFYVGITLVVFGLFYVMLVFFFE